MPRRLDAKFASFCLIVRHPLFKIPNRISASLRHDTCCIEGMKRLVLALMAGLMMVGCGKQISINSNSAPYAIETIPLKLSDLQKVWQGDQGLCEADLRDAVEGAVTRVPVNATYLIQSKTNPNDSRLQCGAILNASVLIQDNGNGTLSLSIAMTQAPNLSIPDGYKLVNVGGPFFSASHPFVVSGNTTKQLWTAPANGYETLFYLFQAE